jgi:hypothetical protein
MKNILEFDCRGLEFVEFKADVSAMRLHFVKRVGKGLINCTGRMARHRRGVKHQVRGDRAARGRVVRLRREGERGG